MRILIVGAGAIGGYFGGRLLEAGRDVCFLVRPRRSAQLAKTGLAIRSSFGDVHIPSPPTITADALRDPSDLILLSCKAYDLKSAADLFVPAVGTATAILPLLNGIGHLDFLTARFGSGAVLGGQCVISTTLDAEGRILHLNDTHMMSFGERDGSMSGRAMQIASTLSGARFEFAPQSSDPAGDVGKVGAHCRDGRYHMPDAIDHWRHRRRGRRPSNNFTSGRMRRDRQSTKLRAKRGGAHAQSRHADCARLRVCRVDASGYRARCADRSRSHHR